MNDYEYEEDLDILYISNNNSKEKPEGNLVIGNMVIDVSKNGKVLGVEIDCASKMFNISSEVLNSLKSAHVKVMKMSNMVVLGVIILTSTKEYSLQIALPNRTNNVPIAVY